MRQVNPDPFPVKDWNLPKLSPKSALIVVIILILCPVAYIAVAGLRDKYIFDHLSPAEHLQIAKQNSDIPGIVFEHLEAIPKTAPEYKEVPALLDAAKEVAKEDDLRHQRIEEENAKTQRDSVAKLSSYWPTTVRVDTDMDSFWLQGEERTCQTYPDGNGRVSVVACNDSGSHRNHNIPVKFWGGVDRNTVSSWRCRREGDDFVCRALN